MTEWKPSPALRPQRPWGPLCLRIVGSARDAQEIQLTSRKCTIGSGEGCTLRLRARGVRPLECLIVRGQGGTLLRSGPRGARLNGHPVDDALLSVGDLLSVGPVDLEIIALDAPERSKVRAIDAACDRTGETVNACR